MQSQYLRQGRSLRFRIGAVVVALCSLLSLPSMAMANNAISAASSTAAKEKICPAGELHPSLPKPPAGMAATMTISLDELCRPVYGPVTFVPQAQAASLDTKDTVNGSFAATNASNVASSLASSGSKCLNASYELYDPVNLLLNKVYAGICWSWNGTVVTSANAGGGWNAHSEAPVFPGWSAVNTRFTQTGGCAGCSSITYTEHAEFSYRGIFDSVGNIYYNNFNIQYVITGSGTRTCSPTITYRTWSALWHLNTSCT